MLALQWHDARLCKESSCNKGKLTAVASASQTVQRVVTTIWKSLQDNQVQILHDFAIFLDIYSSQFSCADTRYWEPEADDD